VFAEIKELKMEDIKGLSFIRVFAFEYDKLINCREQFIVLVYSQRTNNRRITKLMKNVVKWREISKLKNCEFVSRNMILTEMLK
jgi:hypothetical protein